jgi:hypothetical protein
MRRSGSTGVLLVACGGLLAAYLLWRDGAQGIPSALIGLSMVAFGTSMVRRERRERRRR